MKLSDLATTKGCKKYLKALYDNLHVEEDSMEALAFALTIKSAMGFIETLEVYQNKYGLLELRYFSKYMRCEDGID